MLPIRKDSSRLTIEKTDTPEFLWSLVYRGVSKEGEYIEQSIGLFPQLFIAMKIRDLLDKEENNLHVEIPKFNPYLRAEYPKQLLLE